MNITASACPASHSRGITLIEILVGIAVLVVLVSFALPSVSTAALRAEMTAAQENVTHYVEAARVLARTNERPVTLVIRQATGDQARTLHLNQATDTADEPPLMQDFSPPESIILVADRDSYSFDSRGLAVDTGEIRLIARGDRSLLSTIEIR